MELIVGFNLFSYSHCTSYTKGKYMHILYIHITCIYIHMHTYVPLKVMFYHRKKAQYMFTYIKPLLKMLIYCYNSLIN